MTEGIKKSRIKPLAEGPIDELTITGNAFVRDWTHMVMCTTVTLRGSDFEGVNLLRQKPHRALPLDHDPAAQDAHDVQGA